MRQLKQVKLSAIAVLALVALATTATAASARQVTVRSTGTHAVHLAVGDVLRIQITEQRGGGASWHYLQHPARRILRSKDDRYVPPPPTPPGTPPMVGRPGTHIYTYRALRRGHTRIRLLESRPFGSPAERAQGPRLTVRVSVR